MTRRTYDANNRLLGETLPLGQSRQVGYDAAGQVEQDTDFKGQVTTYTYNPAGQVTRRQAGPDVVSHDYENAVLMRATEARGITAFSYDPMGRLLGKQEPDGVTVGYGYDAAGRRNKVSGTQGDTVYTFDELSRLHTVTDAQGQVTRYEYDAEGRKAKEFLPNDVVTSYEYDSRHRLKKIVHRQGEQGALIAQFAYDYDHKGQRTAATEIEGALIRERSFGYDALDRLTSEALRYTDADGQARISERTYRYDSVGNRTQQALTEHTNGAVVRHEVTTSTHDDNNRLTQERVQDQRTQAVTVRDYAYDANGSPLSVTENGVATAYTYDADNRLSAISGPGLAASYAYDAEGHRIGKTVNGLSTRYALDTSQPYAQVLETTDSLGHQRRITHGLGPVAERLDGQTQWLLKDAQQSSRVLTNAAAQAEASLVYTAFGEAEAGTSDNLALLHRYDGEQRDEETGNYYLRARYLDPGLGRFTQKDSWAGNPNNPMTLNPYLFADGNPVMKADPTGHFSLYEQKQVDEIIAVQATQAVPRVLAGSAIDSAAALESGAALQTGTVALAPQALRLWVTLATMQILATVDFSDVESAMEDARSRYRDRSQNDGHHTIPKFLCGHESQELSTINAREHAILHAGLAAVRFGLDRGTELADNLFPVGRNRRSSSGIRALGSQEQGRILIGRLIGSFYEISGTNGWGRRQIGRIFPNEERAFIGVHYEPSCEGDD